MTRTNRQRNQFCSSTIAVHDIETLSQIYDKNSDLQAQDDANENIGRESFNKKIRPRVCDITDLQVDAIVCPTQSDLTLEPYGLSKTIQSRGGLLLQQTCKQIGKIEVGKAAITDGYVLKCKYVIHTAGPSPNTLLDYKQRKACLKKSYQSSLKLVRDTPDVRTVAFPLLGAGGAGIELLDAIRISTTTVRAWLNKPKNAKSVESIVLCFNDTNQWEKYYPELSYVFPYGKDLAGFDTEALGEVPKSWIHIPAKCCKTNILCYKYGVPSSKRIQQHFHLVVNECHDRLCKQIASEHSGDRFSPKLERYDTCAIIQHGNGHYNLIIYNNAELKSIEIQIVCFNSDSRTIYLKMKCNKVRQIIDDSLASQFKNLLQFQTFLRCEKDAIGQRGHQWDLEYLQHSQRTGEHPTCVHTQDADTHALKPAAMLAYWNCSNDNNFSVASKIVRNGEEHSDSVSLSNVSVPPSPILRASPVMTPTGIRRLSNEIEEGDWPLSDVETLGGASSVAMQCRSDLHTSPISEKSTTQARASRDLRENGPERLQLLQKWIKTDESKQDCTDSKVSDTALKRKFTKEIEKTCDENVLPSESTSSPENNLNISSIRSNGSLNETNKMSKQFPNSPRKHQNVAFNIDPCVGEDSFLSLSPPVSSNCSATSPTRERILSARKLLKIARHIGNKQKQLGLELGLSDTEIETLRADNVSDVVMFGYEILKKWMTKQRKKWNCKARLADLINAMKECDIDTIEMEKVLSAMPPE